MLRTVVGVFLAASLTAQEPTGHVVGTVRGPLLEPVANAEVTVRAQNWTVVKRGKTDASGEYRFTDLPRSMLYVCATAPDLHVACESARASADPTSPTRVDVRLFAAATVRGAVNDEDGKPVPGAHVIASFDEVASLLDMGRREEIKTDDQGRFALPKVPLGDVAVRVSAAGFEFGEARLYLERNTEVEVEIKRGKGRQLLVIVEGVPEDRLADIECSLYASMPYPQASMALPKRLVGGKVDKHGEWLVLGLPREPTLSMIRVEAVGMRFQPSYQSVEADQDGLVKFRLEAITEPPPQADVEKPDPDPDARAVPLVPTKVARPTLRGVLRDDKGKPRGLTRVRIYNSRTGYRQAVTAKDGTFEVDAPYQVDDWISFSLLGSDWVFDDRRGGSVVSSGDSISFGYEPDETYRLFIRPARTISGALRGRPGESVAGMRVELEIENRNFDNSRRFTAMAWTDANGEFAIGGLSEPAGPMWLVVRGLRGTAQAGPLKFKGDRDLAGIKMKLEKPVPVTGSVLDRGGQPIAGARVMLADWNGKQNEDTASGDTTLTDAQGRFAYSGMRPGEYTLRVQVRGVDVVASTKPFKVKRKAIKRKIKVAGK